MGPETPRIVDFLLHTFYLYIVLFRMKSYFQRAHRARTAPQDACHPIYNPLTQQPLFDARWHSRLLDSGRPIVARKLRNSLLLGSARELPHLRTRLSAIIAQDRKSTRLNSSHP